MEKNGRTLRKDMAIICRGIREFGCILPGQMGHVCRRSLLAAGIPFVATAVSAHIMGGVAAGRGRSCFFYTSDASDEPSRCCFFVVYGDCVAT